MWKFLVCLLLWASPAFAQSPSPMPIKFRAMFTPLAASVAKCRIEESGRVVYADCLTSTACGTNRCVEFSIGAVPNQTLRFKAIVANTIGQEVASNEATFPVPSLPTAPTLSMSIAAP